MNIPTISPRTYRRLTIGALFTLTTIIVTGAAVRLTGSGLGCPDWPTCANDRVVAPLEFHPMVEFVNRVFTGVCSVAVAIAVLGSIARRPFRKDLLYLSLSLVLGVAAQAVLGGITVLVHLSPPFVMAHFLLSLIIVWAAQVLYHRAGQPDSAPALIVERGTMISFRVLGLLAFVAIFIGTMVTGSGPHGGDENVERLAFSPHDITKVHGIAVWILLVAVGLVLWRLQAQKVSREIVKRGEWLLIALFVQGGLGYLQYSLGVPAFLVLLHVFGSVVVWMCVIGLNLAAYQRRESFGIPVYDETPGPGADGAPITDSEAESASKT